MNKQEVVDFLKKIQKFLFEKKQYESSRNISSAIDVLEDMINDSYYYENLDESKNNEKMKITKNQLRQIIKEEAINLLSESNSFDSISKLVNGEQRKSPYYNLSDEERLSKDVLFLYSILNNKNLGLSLSNQEKFDILNNFLNGDKKFDILNVDLKQIPFIEDLRDKYSMELKKELNESIKKIVREGFKSLLNENRFQIGANRF